MSLDKSLSFQTIIEPEIETSRTYAIDWEKGRIAGFIDKENAIQQYIRKAIMTPRFAFLIYNSQYGCEAEEIFFDKEATMEYIEAELPFVVEDAIIHDERILKVYNVRVEIDERKSLLGSVHFMCDVDTIFGTIPVEEVF